MSLETISLEKKEKVAIIRLNRPKLLNAVNEKLVWDFQEATIDVKPVSYTHLRAHETRGNLV